MLTNILLFLRFRIIPDKIKKKLIFVNSIFEKFILYVMLVFILFLNTKKKAIHKEWLNNKKPFLHLHKEENNYYYYDYYQYVKIFLHDPLKITMLINTKIFN